MNLKLLAVALVIFGILSRLLPHNPNAAAIGALMLFSGTYLPKKLFWVPLLALLISDYFIGFYGTDMFYVYGSYLLIGLIGFWLREHKKGAYVLGSSLYASGLFFLITNFGVWAYPNNWYPHTISGLLQSYTLALPFFKATLFSDLGYTIFLFGGYELARMLVKKYLPRKVAAILV